MKAFRVWLFLGLISACSNSNPGDDAGGGDAANDVTTQKDTGSDVAQGTDTGTDATSSDASDGGSGNFTLTINDYLHWCNVSVNGGANSAQDPQTFQFAPDASVALHGDTAGSQFYWGYWQSASLGDGGLDLSKDAAIQMNANVSVLACCPVNNTGLHCP
ncbi:MAG TPA: hypothetical protein VGH87_04340 [Polyangiaceae bacterium]